LKVPERDGVRAFEYHVVYVRGGMVYDPRMAPEPVDFDAYMKRLSALNPGVRLKVVEER